MRHSQYAGFPQQQPPPGAPLRVPSLNSFQQPAPQPQQPQQDPYNYSGDPALAQILAQDAATRSNAQAAALAAEKRLAIQLGDATGIIGDKNTALEAARNPYSTLASLLKAYNQQKTNTDESANKANLYYSGARAKALQQDAYGYQHQVYDARQQALSALAGIQENLAGSLSGAGQADANGYSQAYQNATSQAQTFGYDPGASTPATSRVGQTRSLNGFGQSGIRSQLQAPPAAMAGSAAFRNLMRNRVPTMSGRTVAP